MTKVFIVLATLLGTILPAAAQQVIEYSASRQTVNGDGEGGRGTELTIDWQANLKVGQLMGEPIVSTRFRYDLTGGTVTLPSPDGATLSDYQTHPLGGLPQEAWTKIDLYDVKLRFEFRSIDGSFYLVSDVGLPGPSGEWSFNVPGSPNWNALFHSSTSTSSDGPFVSADWAKRQVSKGLELVGAEIVEAHVTLHNLHEWYARENPDHYLDAYGAALQHLEEGLKISYGFPPATSKDLETIFGKTLKDRMDILKGYKKRFDKLQNLPDTFRIGDNDAPYEVAARQARLILSSARRQAPVLQNAQLKLPAGRQKGEEAEFHGGYEVRGDVRNQYVADIGTGKGVRKMKLHELLLNARFLTDKSASCEAGGAVFRLRDPKSYDVAKELRFECPEGATRFKLYVSAQYDEVVASAKVRKYVGTRSYDTSQGKAHECLYDEYTHFTKMNGRLKIQDQGVRDQVKRVSTHRKSASWRCRQPYGR